MSENPWPNNQWQLIDIQRPPRERTSSARNKPPISPNLANAGVRKLHERRQCELKAVLRETAARVSDLSTGTAARSSRQDPEVAEASTRTGKELGPSPVTTMVATAAAKVAATDHATGCPTAPGTAAVVRAAVKAAGDRERGIQYRE